MSNYTLLIYTNDMALKTYYKNIETAYGDSSGIDLLIPKQHIIEPTYLSESGCGTKIPLGIYCEMISPQNRNVAFDIRSRSSMGLRTPFRLSNSQGLIDAGYRGELCIIVDNVSCKVQTIETQSKLVQISLGSLEHNITVKVVDYFEDLSVSRRGNNGFGSSG